MNLVLPSTPPSEALVAGTTQDYSVYGLRVRSGTPLTIDPIPHEGSADVELAAGDAEYFAELRARLKFNPDCWIHLFELRDGSTYLRYDELFEFVLSPSGRRIEYHLLGEVSPESLQTYALGRVFSFALVKMGYEPLHGSTVVIDGRAVAFVGASSFGKSSLAACFVAAGHRLLTDDVLRLEERAAGFVAFPGPPRLKLLPKSTGWLGGASRGVLMNRRQENLRYPKRIFALSPEQSFAHPAPLAAIYVLTEPRRVRRMRQVKVGPFSPMEALVKILSVTHNDKVADPARLARHFEAAQKLIGRVAIRSLAYPRVMEALTEVRDAVLEDLKTHANFI